MNKILLGCDPEIFLADAAGALHSAIGKIGGTKQQPRPLPLGDGYAVQEDNVAIEFNIPPAATAEEFDKAIANTIAFLGEAVNDMYGLKLINMSAALFPEAELADPRALEFGCEPDYNAWTGKVNPRPKAADKRLRSCGGHVHVGYKFTSKEQARELIKLMDFNLGVPSTLSDNGDMRKELYGKYGAMRFKPYGVEYRTLSNFWVFHPKLRNWVWEATNRAVQQFEAGMKVDHLQAEIQECINNNNKALAQQLCTAHNLPVVYA